MKIIQILLLMFFSNLALGDESYNSENTESIATKSPDKLPSFSFKNLGAREYSKNIVSKINSLETKNNIDGLKRLLKTVKIYPDEGNIWNESFKKLLMHDNSKVEFIAELLKFASKNELQLISHSYHLLIIIEKYNKEATSLAIALHPNLLSALANWVRKENGHKVFQHMMQENSASVLANSDLLWKFFSVILNNNSFESLDILSKHNITLGNITEIIPDVETEDLIYHATQSTSTGNNTMLNHVLTTLNAHGNPAVLASAAHLENDTFFKNLLKNGYSIDPDLGAKINLIGLARAMKSQNMYALRYYLDQGVDPNEASSLDEAEGNKSIEVLDLLITYGLKVNGLLIATAAKEGSLESIKYFKEKGFNTKHPAIFVAACESNNIELIDFLLSDGANIEDPSALVASARGNNLEIVQHLVEKGANPKNLMALNQSLRGNDFELKIAKYLIEKGAKLEQRCVVSAGLTGNSNTLRWVLKETGTPITRELEKVLNNSNDNIIKYTIEHLVPNDTILIGLTNEGYHFTDGIGGVASKLMDYNPNIFIVPLSEQIADDDSLMLRFSGFINPGAGDSYPKNMPRFSLEDMNQEKIEDFERLYQKVISFAKKYDIPYLGICAGSQHLSLNTNGFIQPVKNHARSITIHFEKGSIPHFMTLLPHEKVKALQECLLDNISADDAAVNHEYTSVKDNLGKNVKLGATSGIDENVPESVYHGHNQIGVQFHLERAYFEEPSGKINRQKILLDNFFQTSLDYQKSRSYALENGFDHIDVRSSIQQANQKLVNHLETCAKNPNHSRKDHFWGHNLGSYDIPANDSKKDASVNVLTGLTPKDVALARDGDNLILIIKSSGEMLSIESHFAPDGAHRVKSIDFADGSRLILNGDNDIKDGFSSHLENQAEFYRNSTSIRYN